MKKMNLIIFFIISYTFNGYAKTEKMEGEIISKNGIDTVVFEVPIRKSIGEPDYQKIQNKIIYFDTAGNKFTLRPDSVQEIRFKYSGKTIRMVALYNSLELGSMFSQGEYIFLKLEIEGNVNVFRYFYIQSRTGGYNFSTGAISNTSYKTDDFILQKRNRQIMRPSWMAFRKDMKEYFADCPALSEKIQNKEFDRNDVLKIVEYYNSNCQ